MGSLRVIVTVAVGLALLVLLTGLGHMLPWHRPKPTAGLADVFSDGPDAPEAPDDPGGGARAEGIRLGPMGDCPTCVPADRGSRDDAGGRDPRGAGDDGDGADDDADDADDDGDDADDDRDDERKERKGKKGKGHRGS